MKYNPKTVLIYIWCCVW